MAQDSSPLPQYNGQQSQDGTAIESSPNARLQRGSSDSRQELLRTTTQPPPAVHLDGTPERVSPMIPTYQNNGLGITPKASNVRRSGGYVEPNEWNTPTRGPGSIRDGNHRRSKTAQDFRPAPQNSITQRNSYVEEYSDGEDEPRAYRPRYTRQNSRPHAAYKSYYNSNARYSFLSGKGRNSLDTPTIPEYHMHYGSDDDYYTKRRSGAGGQGPPRRPASTQEVMRLPWIIWMGSNAKNHFVAFVGEFVGTTMFLFFAFAGTQVANIGSEASPKNNTTTGEAVGFSPIVLLYISLVFAFSLMVNVWVFFRISGGLFNPAVTFAMLLCRALSPTRAGLLLGAQMLGSIFASFLGVFIEAVLTAELVFTIFMLAKEKHKATFIAPVGIGLALFIAELVGVYYTGGSLNPARSFGPCVVSGVFDVEHWIYWVGPGLGTIIAVVFYKLIKILEYEVANPGQDDDGLDEEIKQVMQKESGEDVESGRKPEGQGFGI